MRPFAEMDEEAVAFGEIMWLCLHRYCFLSQGEKRLGGCSIILTDLPHPRTCYLPVWFVTCAYETSMPKSNRRRNRPSGLALPSNVDRTGPSAEQSGTSQISDLNHHTEGANGETDFTQLENKVEDLFRQQQQDDDGARAPSTIESTARSRGYMCFGHSGENHPDFTYSVQTPSLPNNPCSPGTNSFNKAKDKGHDDGDDTTRPGFSSAPVEVDASDQSEGLANSPPQESDSTTYRPLDLKSMPVTPPFSPSDPGSPPAPRSPGRTVQAHKARIEDEMRAQLNSPWSIDNPMRDGSSSPRRLPGIASPLSGVSGSPLLEPLSFRKGHRSSKSVDAVSTTRGLHRDQLLAPEFFPLPASPRRRSVTPLRELEDSDAALEKLEKVYRMRIESLERENDKLTRGVEILRGALEGSVEEELMNVLENTWTRKEANERKVCEKADDSEEVKSMKAREFETRMGEQKQRLEESKQKREKAKWDCKEVKRILSDYRTEIVELHLCRAQAARATGNNHLMSQHVDKALKEAEKLGDRTLWARAYYWQGVKWYSAEHTENAKRFFDMCGAAIRMCGPDIDRYLTMKEVGRAIITMENRGKEGQGAVPVWALGKAEANAGDRLKRRLVQELDRDESEGANTLSEVDLQPSSEPASGGGADHEGSGLSHDRAFEPLSSPQQLSVMFSFDPISQEEGRSLDKRPASKNFGTSFAADKSSLGTPGSRALLQSLSRRGLRDSRDSWRSMNSAESSPSVSLSHPYISAPRNERSLDDELNGSFDDETDEMNI